ncbi:MAG: serine/threonine-protein kinase [Planctomycetota bacterium]
MPDRLFELFQAATRLDPAERTSFVAGVAAEDPDVGERLRALLDEDERAGALPKGDTVTDASLPIRLDALVDAVEPSLAAGMRIGRYALTRLIAEGGQGAVWLGSDPEIGRTVVIKTLRPGLSWVPSAVERLRREIRLTGRLDHRDICPVLDVVEGDGAVHLVMPYIEGETLAHHLRSARSDGEADRPFVPPAPLPETDQRSATWSDDAHDPPRGDRARHDVRPALRLVERLARAVHVAHEAGVIHRDLKPGNIILRPSGDPVILDFGVALDQNEPTRLTLQGEAVGTPTYMAPEQIDAGVGAATPATDVYALGTILFELLTGSPPFASGSRNEIFQRTLHDDAPPLRRYDSQVPRDLESVCRMALERDPVRRYATAEAFADDLRNVRTLNPTVARPLGLRERLWRVARRHPSRSIGVATAVVAAVAILYFARIASDRRDALDQFEVIHDVRAQVGSGETPADEEREILARSASPELRARILDGELTVALLDELSAEVLRSTRSTRERLLRAIGPVGRLARAPESFAFRLATDVHESFAIDGSLRCSLVIRGSTNGIVGESTFDVRIEDLDAGGVRVDSPVAEWTSAGDVTWWVELDPERHGETADFELLRDLAASEPVAFRVDASAAPAGSSGGALARANTLLESGYSYDALVLIHELSSEATPETLVLAGLVAVRARAALGDRDGAERLIAGLRAVVDGDGYSALTDALLAP